MQYFIAFLEGIITFISPCLLPMLPIYISYFVGGGERKTSKTLKNATGFILGFTIIFVLMGALAGSFGKLLTKYSVIVNLITGLIVIFFCLNFIVVFKLNIFKVTKMATSQGKVVEGIIMLLVYSLGLGIPFFLSAVLIDKLRGAFNFIKKHYKVINIICGSLLILVGLLMATGVFGKFIALLS